jgi:hypothetical protein
MMPRMTVHSKVFQSGKLSWEELCDQAATFASKVGRENLINMSVAATGGGAMTGLGAHGVIVVWYWA